MTDWWVGLPAAETRLGCGGETHTLRWHAGELHAVAHDDIEGERALAALGADRCTCVEVLDAWARHAADVRVLTLASRGAADQLAVQVDWLGYGWRGRQRGVATAGRSPGATAHGPGKPGLGGANEVEGELVSLLALGGGLADRLVASVAAAWTQTADRPPAAVASARAQLRTAVYGRIVCLLRTWLGEPSLDIHLQLDDSATANLTRLDDGRIRAELPFRWLSDVWCRGFALLGGQLTLSLVQEHGGSSWLLRSLAPDLLTLPTLRLAFADQAPGTVKSRSPV